MAAALAVTVVDTALLGTDPARLLTLPVVVAEVAVACALEMGDQLAYNGVAPPAEPGVGVAARRRDDRRHRLPGPGRRGGRVSPSASARGVGELVGSDGVDRPRHGRASCRALVLYALAGLVAGFVTARLRQAERRISLAQAREEVARTLHDGVLQTLAVVQRRSHDPDLVRLAHDQERELREFLFGTPATVAGGGDLGARLRAAAARFEDRYGGSARVVRGARHAHAVRPDLVDALAGAVGEALANAGKHGEARHGDRVRRAARRRAVLLGQGRRRRLRPDAIAEGAGLRRSVRGRIAEVGGRVEVDGRPGRGAEVRCWVPLSGADRADAGVSDPRRALPRMVVGRPHARRTFPHVTPADRTPAPDPGPVSELGDLSAVRVVVADDHPIWRSGLRADLGSNFHVVGEAGDADGAIELVRTRRGPSPCARRTCAR